MVQFLFDYKPLEPLSAVIKRIYLDDIEHFSEMSNVYNAMFALCAIGVDKGPAGGGGFEVRGAGLISEFS